MTNKEKALELSKEIKEITKKLYALSKGEISILAGGGGDWDYADFEEGIKEGDIIIVSEGDGEIVPYYINHIDEEWNEIGLTSCENKLISIDGRIEND